MKDAALFTGAGRRRQASETGSRQPAENRKEKAAGDDRVRQKMTEKENRCRDHRKAPEDEQDNCNEQDRGKRDRR